MGGDGEDKNIGAIKRIMVAMRLEADKITPKITGKENL